MSNDQFIALLPQIILAAGSILLLLSIAFKRNHAFAAIFALIVLASSFLSLFFTGRPVNTEISDLLIVDNFSLFFNGMILFASFMVLLMSYPYLQSRIEDIEEYYVLIILAALGSTVVVSGSHFISFFLGLELLSTSLYVLIAFLRDRDNSAEAGIKYLILAAASSAMMLFGIALVYAEYGTMYIPELTGFLRSDETTLISTGGIAFILAGIGFKLALVPFHMWTPDVYEGAPAPVTAFIATVSKAGVFAFFLRFITATDAYTYIPLFVFLWILSAASMLTGNILALLERNVKRILAYSSIAHLGYLLVAFLTAGEMAAEASAFYFAAYIITITGAFAVVSYFSGLQADAGDLDIFRGLFWKNPWIAAVFTIILFSLAGLPLTAGFIGKFYILLAGVQSELWWLVIILVISSTIGLFYYLRIIVSMFSAESSKYEPQPEGMKYVTNNIVVYSTAVLLIFIGVYPSILIRLIEMMSLL